MSHRWRTLVHAREMRRELEEEMQAHLEMAAQQHATSGNARDQAHREFGSIPRWATVVADSWPRLIPGQVAVLLALPLILALGIAGASTILSAASAMSDAGGGDPRFSIALGLVRASAIMFAAVAAAAALDLESAGKAHVPVWTRVSCVVAMCAAAVAARWLTGVIHDSLPSEIASRIHGWENLSLDGPLFAVATAVVVAPVMWIRLDLSIAAHHRMLRGMRTAQVALTVILVAAATLMTRSAMNIAEAGVGFETASTWGVRVQARSTGPSGAHWDSLLARMARSDGVRAAGLVTHLPLTQTESRERVSAESFASPRRREGTVRVQAASDAYFSALGIPLTHGRAFDARDHESSEPVAIVNQEFAARYARTPAGLAFVTTNGVRRRVVGIVGDVRHYGADAAAGSEVYVPLRQGTRTSELDLVVRHAGECAPSCARALIAAVVSAGGFELHEPGLAMRDRMRRHYAGYRLAASLLIAFAGAAFLIAVLVLCLSPSAVRRERMEDARCAIAPLRRRRALRGGSPVGEPGVVFAIAGVLTLLRLTQPVTFGLASYDTMSLAAAVIGLAALYTAARIRDRSGR